MSRLDATWELLMPDGRHLPESHTETCEGCAECEGAEVVRIEEQDEGPVAVCPYRWCGSDRCDH